MAEVLPMVYLARHGETAWSLSGQHTGRTDLPLTGRGEQNARRLGERLKGLSFASVLTSPLKRAARTCDLAGFGVAAREVSGNSRNIGKTQAELEWDYGEYEGRRTAEIHRERREWDLFRDGCPGGETPDQVGARADDAVRRVPRPRRERAALFKRPLPARVCRSLVGARTAIREIFFPQHGEPQRAGIRT